MINSIQHFIEKETYEIENTMREFVEGTLDIDAYGKQLQEKALKLTQDILVETLETMDQMIKDSEKRKEAYVVEQRNQPKTLLLPFGSICFHRTCYTAKKTGRSSYLLDELIGLEKHQRLTPGAEAAILEEAVESSYRKGGEHASLTEQVSKQTVKNLVHLLDSAQEVKREIYEALYKKDKPEVREIYKKILNVTGNENKYQEVEESLKYLMNNWRGITVYSDDGGAVWGCHAEGQVSHVLSSRMSSRPMGWSRTGADQMSKLRAYHMNGGKIIDLLNYQKGRKKREERIEKQEELVRELRRVQAGRKHAERLQGSVPGKEAHSMKWMRALLNEQLCC